MVAFGRLSCKLLEPSTDASKAQQAVPPTDLERTFLPCLCLAHHDLKSINVVMVFVSLAVHKPPMR